MALFNKYSTSLDIVQNAIGQLALPVPSSLVPNPNDETAQQMLRLLTWSGRRLLKPTATYRWEHMMRTFTLMTVPLQLTYDVPEDWDSFEDLTGWNFTSRLPMLGPATGPQWQCLKARSLGSSTISVVYRMRRGQIELYSDFADPQELRIDYSSRAWVRDATGLIFRDYIAEDDDVVLFDNELITAKLKLAFLTAKGFDTTSAQAEYNELEEQAICADTDAPVLQVSPSGGSPLISTQFNVPDTGYG